MTRMSKTMMMMTTPTTPLESPVLGVTTSIVVEVLMVVVEVVAVVAVEVVVAVVAVLVVVVEEVEVVVVGETVDVVRVAVVVVVVAAVAVIVVAMVVIVAVVVVAAHTRFSPEVSLRTPTKPLKAFLLTDQLLPLHSIATTLFWLDEEPCRTELNKLDPNDSKKG